MTSSVKAQTQLEQSHSCRCCSFALASEDRLSGPKRSLPRLCRPACALPRVVLLLSRLPSFCPISHFTPRTASGKVSVSHALVTTLVEHSRRWGIAALVVLVPASSFCYTFTTARWIGHAWTTTAV